MPTPVPHAVLAVPPEDVRALFGAFHAAGFAVTACWSTTEARRVLDSPNDVAVLVAHAGLPGAGGFELVRRYLAGDTRGRAVLVCDHAEEMPVVAHPRLVVFRAPMVAAAVLAAARDGARAV